ncbi:MAG: hypothetical protein V7K37_00850 [Nostoc sp.]
MALILVIVLAISKISSLYCCPKRRSDRLSLSSMTIASLEQGQPVIPVWLDIIYQQLAEKLRK